MIWETKDFFTQKIKIENVEESRFLFFKNLCKDKKVLHVGCADSMFFNPDQNLHISLNETCKELHGLDNSLKDINELRKYLNGKYFDKIEDCDDNYDIIIVPEVIEHVDNLRLFLDKIFSFNFKEIVITAPNIFHYFQEMKEENGHFIEVIHPDHKYWFSPYTMYNITKQYVKSDYEHKIYFLENKSMVCAHIIKIN